MQEGADILMVKPGLAYLDVVKATKTKVCHGNFLKYFEH